MSQTSEVAAIDDLPYLDVQSDAWAHDPWAEIRKVRGTDARGGRLARSHRGVEVLSYELFTKILSSTGKQVSTMHADNWAERGAGPWTLEFVENGHMLSFEPERHLKIRRIMVSAFRMSHIEERRDWFHETADRLVDGFVDSGRCDIVDDFSHRYSIEILCAMIGVPAEDIPQFERATLDIAFVNNQDQHPTRDRLEAALKTIWDYSTDIVERRRREPREDFISGLIRAQETEGKLSESEAIWGVANLLFAGHDTTRYQIASTIYGLLHAGFWEELAQHKELIPRSVEEGMRLFSILNLSSRQVQVDDLVLDGVALPAGTILRLNWLAFNRDPERFREPERFDIHRTDFEGRMPFGGGVHKCIGHALARTDIEVAVEVLTSRLTDVRVDGEIPWHPYTAGLGGPDHLPLAFRAR